MSQFHRHRNSMFPALLLAVSFAQAQKLDSNWVSLFNSKDLNNWYAYISPPGGPVKRYEIPADDPGKNYRIANGEIVYSADPLVSQTVGYLGTDSTYSRYQFRVEYKLGTNCAKGLSYCKNSGLMYHMVADGIFGTGIESNMYWDWPTAIAALGGVKFTKSRPNFGNFQSEADSMNKYTTDGAWNVMEVRVWADSAVQQFVNGHLGGWAEGIKRPDGSPLKQGHIALQIEGNDVSFRNPRIRDLDRRVDTLGCTAKGAPNYDPMATKDDGSCKPTGLGDKTGTEGGYEMAGSRLSVYGEEAYLIDVRDVNGRAVIRTESGPAPRRIKVGKILVAP